MAIKIGNTTVIDDSKNFNLVDITFSDTTLQNTAPNPLGMVRKYIGGSLVHALDNPNTYSTSAGDNFGRAVAIDGNYAIVGAYPEDDATGSDSGKVYIFNVTTGALVHALSNPTVYGTGDGDRFGVSVAISGNYAIVGANLEDDVSGVDSGKAYIFNVTTGALIHALDNPNTYSTSAGDYFGYSVAISGNYAIVGASQEDDAGGSSSGKAYIFNVTTSALVHALSDPNYYGTSSGDFFGSSVAISGNYAIVGAYGEDDAPTNSSSGKAYIFNVTTGALIHALSNPNYFSTGNLDYFGYSVAISGDYAIVGAYGEDDAAGATSGKAYIYNVTTGALVHALSNPNYYGTSTNDLFGRQVAIAGNYAIVGASQEDDGPTGSASGKAYIYNVTTGALVHALSNPNYYDTSGSDLFGSSVAIAGNYAIVSAYGEDDGPTGSSSGKAYIFTTDYVYDLINVEKIKFANGYELSYDNFLFSHVPTSVYLTHTLKNPNVDTLDSIDYFANSAAISGNYAIVGAYEEDDTVTDQLSGKAYIFNAITGTLVHVLNNPNYFSTGNLDYFGWSVAIDGNYAIVSAISEDDVSGADSGKAYIFNVTTGALVHALSNPNYFGTSAGDQFGYSVAISGNYAIVGANLEDDIGGNNSGKAYIYNVTTGALVHVLNNPNYYGTSAGDVFGYSVAISGNYAIVGAYAEDDATGGVSGKAYIYNVTTGALVHALNNPNYYGIGATDYFGWSVAIDGNYAIVGAPLEDDGPTGSSSGKAYIFNVTTGALVHALSNPNYYSTGASDNFGGAVAISGNYAIVGADGEDSGPDGNNSGKAYIYNVITGALIHALNNPNSYDTGFDNDLFGASVSISGNYTIIGAPNEASGITPNSSGATYIFKIPEFNKLVIEELIDLIPNS